MNCVRHHTRTGGGGRSETIYAYVTSKKIIDLRKSIALFGLEFYKNSKALPVSFLHLIYNSRLAFALYKYQGRGCTIAKTKKKEHLHNLNIPPYSVDKKNQLDVTFVFFISLLIVAQHVSGNHVPIIRS
jgi:hypothetical protein